MGRKKKHSPLPHHFSKKKYTFYFWGWAIFLSNTISAINLLPVSFASIALHYIFGAFLCAGVFRQLPTTTTPHPHHPHHPHDPLPHPHHPTPSPSQIKNIAPTIGNLASSRVIRLRDIQMNRSKAPFSLRKG